jgi:L-threonylcarbamoyladenylate synthase
LHTEVVAADQPAITRAVEYLRQGRTVALPTETVYGLAADALNPDAVASIFAVKERPRFDPLIVHLPAADSLNRMVRIPEEDRKLVDQLTERFWPGPLTLVLPRQSIVPDIVAAGLETVAVRMSSHPAFAQIVRAFGGPVAAPSANRFGRISPTTAQHVMEELHGRIPLIIDGGPTRLGLESTIVSVGSGRIRVLRKGPVTAEELQELATVEYFKQNDLISAPGQLPSHYAPRTPLRVILDASSFTPPPGKRVGLLAWQASEDAAQFDAVRKLSANHDLNEAAARLFRFLRELDALELDLIVAEQVPDQGLGAAIMDRLHRASSGRGDSPESPTH